MIEKVNSFAILLKRKPAGFIFEVNNHIEVLQQRPGSNDCGPSVCQFMKAIVLQRNPDQIDRHPDRKLILMELLDARLYRNPVETVAVEAGNDQGNNILITFPIE